MKLALLAIGFLIAWLWFATIGLSGFTVPFLILTAGWLLRRHEYTHGDWDKDFHLLLKG